MEVDIGGEIGRNFQSYAAVTRFESPSGSEGRARGGANIDASVARLDLKFVETSIGLDVPVASGGVEFAIDPTESHRAVAGVQVHRALKAGYVNSSVARAKVGVTLARHLDRDVHAVSGSPLE